MRRLDLLIYVEDPGAANYVARLPAALSDFDIRTKLIASALARNQLADLGVAHCPPPDPLSAGNILDTERPRMVIVGTSTNPDTLGLALVDEARSRGVSTVGVVDLPTNAAFRFRGRSEDPLAHVPDWLVVPDQVTERIFVELGFSSDRIAVCGHPHYDHVNDVRRRLLGRGVNLVRRKEFPDVPAGRCVIVFATETSVRLAPISPAILAEFTMTGTSGVAGRTEVAIEEFLRVVKSMERQPFLVLRIHPKDEPEDYAAYLSEFDLVSHRGSPLEMLFAADLVVGLTSMLLMEAALLGTATLSLCLRHAETEWSPSARLGATLVVRTRDTLESAFSDTGFPIWPVTDLEDVVSFGALARVTDFVKKRLVFDEKHCGRQPR